MVRRTFYKYLCYTLATSISIAGWRSTAPFLEWNSKPIALVDYAGVGGVRAIEDPRGIAIALQMALINSKSTRP